MTSRKLQPSAAGFSMIEFLLAAFILSIGLLGLIALQTMALGQSTSARERTIAAQIAADLLQRAQVEGQQSYFSKLNTLTSPYVTAFTANPGTGVAEAAFGGFNIDGVQVKDAAGSDVPNLAVIVPDPNKRFALFTVTWVRRGYEGPAPISAAQSQEYVVNVSWQENQVPKYLSMSRVIRY